MGSYIRTMASGSNNAGKVLVAFLVISLLSCAICSAALSSYQDAAQKCDQEIQKKLAKLSGDYANDLNSLMDTFRSRGDLERTLAVNKEKGRFASEGTLEERHLVEIPIQLRELQQKYLAAPKKAIEQIAKSYVADLEEIKRKLTIDDKLDHAQAAQREVEKIQKKYGVVNPTRGSELRSQDLPKYVAMAKDLSIPFIVDGQRVGLTSLSAGQAYKLVKVDGPQVTIRVAQSDVVVPVDATDLLQRIERKQKGIPEEAAEEDDGGVEARLSAYLRNSTWTWRDADEINFDEKLNIRNPGWGWTAEVVSIRGLEMRLRLTSSGRAAGNLIGHEAVIRFSSDLTSYRGADFGGNQLWGRLIRKNSR